MPFTDLVRTLNTRSRPPTKGLHSTSPFVAADGRVFVHYANLRLESRFLPWVETTSGQVIGHRGELRTVGLGTGQKPGQELTPDAVFALPTDAEELVYLDRLVRTLHALNYLTHPSPGNLLLKVHPRHVASIPTDHGLAFEEILRPCGLVPAQITLEIEAGGQEDREHLKGAIANYKRRGYSVVLSRFGQGDLDFGLLEEARPDIVKLDPVLFASGRPLQRLIAALHNLNFLVMAEGMDLKNLGRGASAIPVDLLQLREPLRRLIHAPSIQREPAAAPAPFAYTEKIVNLGQPLI